MLAADQLADQVAAHRRLEVSDVQVGDIGAGGVDTGVVHQEVVPREGFQGSCGAIADAAGTTALNAATCLDMAVRARPASSTPEQVVQRRAELVGTQLPGNDDERQARESGLGNLLFGALAGVSAGVLLAALRAPVTLLCTHHHPNGKISFTRRQ